MDIQDISAYREQLENIKRMYESFVINGAHIHTFNTFYSHVLNTLLLAERDLMREGSVTQEREAAIKRHFNNLSEYVGKLIGKSVAL
jgi:hypothetical protein